MFQVISPDDFNHHDILVSCGEHKLIIAEINRMDVPDHRMDVPDGPILI
jgi:hypothetical protein